MICPACGSHDVHRSRRKWYEKPMTLIGMRPYRCHSCQHRFFSGQPKNAGPEKKTAAGG